jgi:hypothetical protein
MKTFVIICIAFLLYPVYASAQSYWLNQTGNNSLSFEWDKPVFDLYMDDEDGEKISGMTSVLFITARAKAGERLTLVADLPLSHFGGTFATYDYNWYSWSRKLENHSNTALGNIYIGGEYRIRPELESIVSHLKFGLRLPTAPDYDGDFISGRFTGRLSEFDRLGAFETDTWLLRFLASSIIDQKISDLKVMINAGLNYQVFTGRRADYLDNMWYFQYAFTLLYTNDQVEAYLGISGSNPFHGNDADLVYDGISQVRAGLGKNFNGWSASIYARRPLTESVHDFMKFSYGVMISIGI